MSLINTLSNKERELLESDNCICILCGIISSNKIKACIESLESVKDDPSFPGVPCTLDTLTLEEKAKYSKE